MANKTIRTDAPDTVAGVQRRVAAIKRENEKSRWESFNNLILDTLAGIAEAGTRSPRHRQPDDPVEVAREVLRYGAELYAEHGGAEMWITWPTSTEKDDD